MVEFRIGNKKEDPRPWWIEYKDKTGTWVELADSRTGMKHEVASFLNVAKAAATAQLNHG